MMPVRRAYPDAPMVPINARAPGQPASPWWRACGRYGSATSTIPYGSNQYQPVKHGDPARRNGPIEAPAGSQRGRVRASGPLRRETVSGAGSSPGRLKRAGKRLAGSRGPGRVRRAPGLDVARGPMPAGAGARDRVSGGPAWRRAGSSLRAASRGKQSARRSGSTRKAAGECSTMRRGSRAQRGRVRGPGRQRLLVRRETVRRALRIESPEGRLGGGRVRVSPACRSGAGGFEPPGRFAGKRPARRSGSTRKAAGEYSAMRRGSRARRGRVRGPGRLRRALRLDVAPGSPHTPERFRSLRRPPLCEIARSTDMRAATRAAGRYAPAGPDGISPFAVSSTRLSRYVRGARLAGARCRAGRLKRAGKRLVGNRGPGRVRRALRLDSVIGFDRNQ